MNSSGNYKNDVEEYEMHELVWAKVSGFPWWPAHISYVPLESDQKFRVEFLGENYYGFVAAQNIKRYQPFRKKYTKVKKDSFVTSSRASKFYGAIKLSEKYFLQNMCENKINKYIPQQLIPQDKSTKFQKEKNKEIERKKFNRKEKEQSNEKEKLLNKIKTEVKIFDEKNNTEENIEKVDEILRRKKIAGESLEKIKLFFREDVFKDVDAETLINKKQFNKLCAWLSESNKQSIEQYFKEWRSFD